MKAEEEGRVDEAIDYYKKASEAGAIDGFLALGSLFESGNGIEKSYETAMEWYRKAVDAGDNDAWWLLANIYQELEDYEHALECYEKAAMEGDVFKDEAAFDLGILYHPLMWPRVATGFRNTSFPLNAS